MSSTTNKAAVSLKQEQNEQQINAAKQAEEEQLKKLINEMSSKDQKVMFFYFKFNFLIKRFLTYSTDKIECKCCWSNYWIKTR